MREAIIIIKDTRTKEKSDYQNLINLYKKNKIKYHVIDDLRNKITLFEIDEMLAELRISTPEECDIISDSKHLIFSAYRVYHEGFANFVYLFNEKLLEIYNDFVFEQRNFMKNLIEFNGIRKENIYKKIHSNVNYDNYVKFFVKNDYAINYIDLLSKINLNRELYTKKIMNKIYFLSETESFAIDFGAEHTINIDFSDKHSIVWDINNENEAQLYAYFTLYFTLSNNLKDYSELVDIFEHTNQKSLFEKYVTFTAELIRVGNLDPKISIQLLHILLKKSTQYDFVLDKITHFMDNNKLCVDYWKSLMMYLNLMQFRKAYLFSDLIYKEMKEKNLYISDSIKKQLNYQLNKLRPEKKVVIFTDQILALYHHAPTLILKTLVEGLLENSEYEILVISEENFIAIDGEYIPGAYFNGNPSNSHIGEFEKSFDNNRVSVHLADANKSLLMRTKEIIKVVDGFNPEVIISLSSYSTAQNILYEAYPVINISNGIEFLPSRAHLYLYKNGERAKQIENKLYGDNSLNIKQFIYDGEFIPRTKSYSRSSLGFSENDFLIITTGNRIVTEIDNDLIDRVKLLLQKYPKIHWLLVGSSIPKYLLQTYDKDLLQQIHHRSYEPDLIALNEVCDISINPNRIGGGYAVGSCMLVGTPVLMCEFESDGLIFLGRENASGKSYDEVLLEVEKMYQSSEYKKKIGLKQKKFFNQNYKEKNIFKLLEHINDTIKLLS